MQDYQQQQQPSSKKRNDPPAGATSGNDEGHRRKRRQIVDSSVESVADAVRKALATANNAVPAIDTATAPGTITSGGQDHHHQQRQQYPQQQQYPQLPRVASDSSIENWRKCYSTSFRLLDGAGGDNGSGNNNDGDNGDEDGGGETRGAGSETGAGTFGGVVGGAGIAPSLGSNNTYQGHLFPTGSFLGTAAAAAAATPFLSGGRSVGSGVAGEPVRMAQYDAGIPLGNLVQGYGDRTPPPWDSSPASPGQFSSMEMAGPSFGDLMMMATKPGDGGVGHLSSFPPSTTATAAAAAPPATPVLPAGARVLSGAAANPVSTSHPTDVNNNLGSDPIGQS